MQGNCAAAYNSALDDTDDGIYRPLPQPFRNLYAAAAAACLAAFEGQANRWQDAESRLKGVNRNDVSCWEKEIYDITAEIINAHKSEPSAIFQRSSAGGASSCPLLTGIDPSHGPQSGGYRVKILGENLPAVLPLDFADVKVDAERQPDGSVTVEVPAAESPGIESVHILGTPGRGVSPTLSFTYDPDESSPTQDETTSEEPSDEPTTNQPTPDESTPDVATPTPTP